MSAHELKQSLPARESELLLSNRASRFKRLSSLLLTGLLFSITSVSMVTVLFIIYFIARDAIPYFQLHGFKEFFTSAAWYPADGQFGTLAIFVGSGLVTLGAIIVAVPLGVAASITLSDLLPWRYRQIIKPVIELLAAIPSVAYGFFALVIFAPLLQEKGGALLSLGAWILGIPLALLLGLMLSDMAATRFGRNGRKFAQIALFVVFEAALLGMLYLLAGRLADIVIHSGRNAFNVSIVLGIMALPTIVSVSEDALQAVGRELREGSYALGATRAETIIRVVMPAASSGIIAAVILGTMRALGETMVVWMASGNSAHIPEPWFNLMQPVRTLTATIAGDMGEAEQVAGAARYHVLFAMALALLLFSFFSNLISERIVARSRRKLKGGD
ncbi:MAG: phosphate ABC transporter permease subunit PstC [Candidatus Cloacimonetes bacterium]|nr:phosphate ABC transporter permease subunit PstC [Candidatus Cloacimonadota bacterium]